MLGPARWLEEGLDFVCTEVVEPAEVVDRVDVEY